MSETLGPMWEYLAWSCNVMYQGKYPSAGFRGSEGPFLGPCQVPGAPMYGGRKVRLVELRGDWKHHMSVFHLKHGFTSNNICHRCLASRTDAKVAFTDFTLHPAWKATLRSHEEILRDELGDPLNLLVYVAKFDCDMIKFDSMHTVQLGCGLHANGSALFELFKVEWFGSAVQDKNTLFSAAYKNFKSFLRLHDIACSQPAFKPWMLVVSGTEYCYFASKVQWPNLHHYD